MSDYTDPVKLLVEDASSLRGLCRNLRAAGVFGFDTEFIRERSYLPQLCLVQVATADLVALIDPFSVQIDEFWRLLLDPTLEKVVHAGQQDIEMCYLSTGNTPANIFDVQVAAAFTGLPYPMSYHSLVQRIRRVKLVHDATFSEWSQRPLTKGQLGYAADDVLHLVPLKEKLDRKLCKLGRAAWMAEEMQALVTEEQYAAHPQELWRKVRGRKQLGRRELAVLRELAQWRESAAEQADLPPRTFLRDEAMSAVARQMPRTMDQLQATRGFPKPLARRAGKAVLRAVRKGRETPEAKSPHAVAEKEHSPSNKMLTNLATAIGESMCLWQGLSHNLLASQSDYAELVRSLQRKGPDLGRLKLMTGWRKEFAGMGITEVLTGKRNIRVKSLPKGPRLELA